MRPLRGAPTKWGVGDSTWAAATMAITMVPGAAPPRLPRAGALARAHLSAQAAFTVRRCARALACASERIASWVRVGPQAHRLLVFVVRVEYTDPSAHVHEHAPLPVLCLTGRVREVGSRLIRLMNCVCYPLDIVFSISFWVASRLVILGMFNSYTSTRKKVKERKKHDIEVNRHEREMARVAR